MKLTGLHFLLTYQCTFECDHCFVWGSPSREGAMTIRSISYFLRQALETETIKMVYFEGGEPFLFYSTLLIAAKMAKSMGFSVGIVTNAYWGKSVEDALVALKPFQKCADTLSLSCDLHHRESEDDPEINNVLEAAEMLEIPAGIIRIQSISANFPGIGSSSDYGTLMFKGRAAEKLTSEAPKYPWDSFTECPHEDFYEPGRVHVDFLGNLHICQGIVVGNIFQKPLSEICRDYSPEKDSIFGILSKEGPVGLVRHFDLPHQNEYADACHLCYQARSMLRKRFPNIFAPSQMYGEM